MRERSFDAVEVGKVYDMLIGKLCRSGRFDEGRRLWEAAAEAEVPLRGSPELLDPSKTEVFSPCSEKEDEQEALRKKIITKKKKKKKIILKRKKMK